MKISSPSNCHFHSAVSHLILPFSATPIFLDFLLGDGRMETNQMRLVALPEDVIAHHTSKQYTERFDYQVNNMREE